MAAEGGGFAYPLPHELARLRAERARGAGQSCPALWGSVGGLTTLQRHGPEHYARLARRRVREDEDAQAGDLPDTRGGA